MKILDYLKPPHVESDDFQKQIKTKFIWRIVLVTTIGIGILSLLTLAFGPVYFYLYVIAFVFSLTCLITLNKVGSNYYIVTNIMFIGIIGAQYYAVLTIPHDIHFIESLYIIIIALFSFFALGKWWGFFYLFVTAILYTLYFNFFYITVEDFERISQNGSLIADSFEVLISLFLLGYVMSHYERLNKHAKELYTGGIALLRNEKEIADIQNKEKTVMLKEIHHRVKNNLQVIISLLRIQSNSLPSEESKIDFEKAINRIMTMSLVHQKMYEKESLVNVNLKEYVETLLCDMIASTSKNIKVSYNLEIELEHLTPEKVVPLGLILNELIDNSLQHAFKEDGFIEIKISDKINNEFTLLYFDNGKWKEIDKDITFGMDLIDIFTDQLDGTYERKITEVGTYYVFGLKG